MMVTAAGEVMESCAQLVVRCDPGVPFATFLQVRPHRGGGEDDGIPSERALFVMGVSPSWGEEDVREIFQAFGDVERVAVGKKRTSALVLFGEEEALAEAMQFAGKSGRQLLEVDLSSRASVGEDEPRTGLKSWVARHRALRPGREVLQKQLDDWMAAFDDAEAEAQRAAEEAAAEDDGWTVVGNPKGRKKTTSASGVAMGGVSVSAAEAKRDKQAKGLTDFYRFQQREERRSELLNLRKKFAEDKKKIAQLKASRKFKPY